MIDKDLDPASPSDKFEKAGRAAEEQMAFYLRRAFKDERKVRVFNGLRFVRDGEVAQIDHLVLHKNGFVIIESKSVVQEMRIDRYGAWTRVFKGVEHGMQSPINQARLQADILYKVLDDHKAPLLGKMLGLQKQFGAFPIDVLVAISDGGVLKRAAEEVAPEACKADQITDRIFELIARYRKQASLFSPTFKVAINFGDNDMERIAAFLPTQHTPFSQAYRTPASSSPKSSTSAASEAPLPSPVPIREEPAILGASTCLHCQSTNLTLDYRYDFFLRCKECSGATPLVLHCPTCNQAHKKVKKAAAIKDQGTWRITCSQCGTRISIEVPKPTPMGVPASSS